MPSLEEIIKSHATLLAIDNGLRSPDLPDQMATIEKFATYLRDNPFPVFVNTAVIRICEIFRDSASNALRLCIVRVMGECSAELGLVFSKEEVARRILIVSHANDPLARSLTLQMLAKFSSILAENKQVHHLIVTSIDSEEPQERAAAIVATNAYASVSKEFSHTAFEKLRVLLSSSAVSPAIQIRLVGVFASMNADVDVVMKLFALAEQILREAYNQQLMYALIAALTSLACKCKFVIPDFLTFLLERLKTFHENHENRVLCVMILRNIKSLVTGAHMFNNAQVCDLCDIGEKLNDAEARSAWLSALVRLTAQNVNKVNQTISEYCSRWGFMLSDSNSKSRLLALHLFVNLFSQNPSPIVASLLQCTFIAHLNNVSEENAEKLYRLLTVFVRQQSCPASIVDSLIEAVIRDNVPLSSDSFLKVLQFLVASAETHPHLYSRLSQWAAGNLTAAIDFSNITLYACLVYPPLGDLSALRQDHLSCWGSDPWTLYLVARAAMRNGHSKQVALPILEEIQKERKTFQTRLWLSALRDICCAAISDFTVAALDDSFSKYNRAFFSLSTLSACRDSERYFCFARDFTRCISSVLSVIRSVLVAANTTVSMAGDPLSPHIRSRFSMQLMQCSTKMNSCRDLWVDLYRNCFDADDDTLLTLDLYCSLCAILGSALLLFVQEYPLPSVGVPSPFGCSVVNSRLRVSIVWARSQLEKLDSVPFDKRFHSKNIAHLLEVLAHLTLHPVCIPRFFFQQLKCTQIKLNISPKPRDNDPSIMVLSTQKVPITVEGAVDSPDVSSIETIVINATAKFDKKSVKDYSQRQLVALRDEKFFKAQFLLSFPQNCTMEFSLEFMDKETKRRWQSTARAELSISVADR